MKLVSTKYNDEIDIHSRHLVGACRVSDFCYVLGALPISFAWVKTMKWVTLITP